MGFIRCQIMQTPHDGQFRASGESYEQHPIAVACFYRSAFPHDHLGIGLSLDHDVIEGSSITQAELASFLGREVAFMVDALSKRDRSDFKCHKDRVKEYYSRLFSKARMNKRIALVKLADRWHNVSTIQALGFEKAVNILDETEQVLLPFFRSMGLPLTGELASLCLSQRRRLTELSLPHVVQDLGRNSWKRM